MWTDGAEAAVKGGVIGAGVGGYLLSGGFGTWVSYAISSLPSSAGRRVPECGGSPVQRGSGIGPILGQDNLIFKLKGNQTKTPLQSPGPKIIFSIFKSSLLLLATSYHLHSARAAAILT